jgi:hypothetical protein
MPAGGRIAAGAAGGDAEESSNIGVLVSPQCCDHDVKKPIRNTCRGESMPFPESVKIEAKRRANYRCVVCQHPWVEVHHIQPEAEGGPSTTENAAPLCAGCLRRYGGNPDLRKQLREMRDHWWERCAQAQYVTVDAGLAQRVDDLQAAVLQGQKRNDEALDEVKAMMLQQLLSVQQQIMASGSSSGVFNATSALSSGLPAAYEVARRAAPFGVIKGLRAVPGAGYAAIIELPLSAGIPPKTKPDDPDAALTSD